MAAAAAGLLLAVLAWRGVRRVASGHHVRADDVLTFVVAGVATAVAVTGMWRFFGVVLGIGGPERAGFAAVLELATFAEAVRAKRNMAGFGSAGQDGIAMWALAALSGVLAAWSAGSLAAAAFRLTMPLVAAWLWHRGLALARRRATGRVIHWRLTAERTLVRLGLADPTEREASEVAAVRRVTVLAQSAKRLRLLRASGARGWRIRWAAKRLDAAMTRAVEFADLAVDPVRQSALLAQLGSLNGAEALAELDVPAPWDAVPGTYLDETQPPSPDEPIDKLLTWLTSGSNGVPAVPGELNGHAREARELFAAGLRRGELPSIRAIRTGLRVGQDKAQQVQAYLRTLTRT